MAAESPSSVLIVKADNTLAQQISLDLQEAGYMAVTVNTTDKAKEFVKTTIPAMVVIDRSLAGESGLTLCQELREQGCYNPIIVLMARDAVEDRVACLEAGADDYFIKPYRTEDFLFLSRLYLQPDTTESEQLRFADLALDLSTRRAIRNQRMIELTMKEFELLKYLMEHPREVMTREQILENVWGYDFMGESNVIEVYVRYLRLKIEDDGEKRLIQTVRGVGYVLREA